MTKKSIKIDVLLIIAISIPLVLFITNTTALVKFYELSNEQIIFCASVMGFMNTIFLSVEAIVMAILLPLMRKELKQIQEI